MTKLLSLILGTGEDGWTTDQDAGFSYPQFEGILHVRVSIETRILLARGTEEELANADLHDVFSFLEPRVVC